jgi:hypothetical protein
MSDFETTHWRAKYLNEYLKDKQPIKLTKDQKRRLVRHLIAKGFVDDK